MESSAIHLDRLACLRAEMKERGLTALLIPSADPHQSEYLPEHWRGRAWASGFTGSVGHLIVTEDRASLLVDSRYLLQAHVELMNTGIDVVETTSPRATNAAILAWLTTQLPSGARIAVDGNVLGLALAQTLKISLAGAGMTLLWQRDVLDTIWKDRPALPTSLLTEHSLPEAGATRVEKLTALRQRMSELGVDCHLTISLDEIAWLLNLRGTDVPFNPVFISHLLVGQDACQLFAGSQRVDEDLRRKLSNDGVELHEYAAINLTLQTLNSGIRLLLDPTRVNVNLFEQISENVEQLHAPNPLQLLKSQRNLQQIQYLRAAMNEDGAALCQFYAEFETDLAKNVLTEMDIHTRITECRAHRKGFRGPSFNTIAGFGPNAAMPHYSATKDTALLLNESGLLLIDSGGHYLGGTTDITRVWPIGGTPSEPQRRDYTLVLKGLIALSRLRFPRGTLAPMLDAVARAPLWADGLNYNHGTGHGVGHYLNVHEGPQVFAQIQPEAEMALLPGMVISIEPGIYRVAQWGIRLENLVLCTLAESTTFGDFLAFETLTQCPFDTQCIDLKLLNVEELAWINNYHEKVRLRLTPLLDGSALNWLREHTEPLGI